MGLLVEGEDLDATAKVRVRGDAGPGLGRGLGVGEVYFGEGFGEPVQVAGAVCLDRLGEAIELKDSQRDLGVGEGMQARARESRDSTGRGGWP